MMLARKDAVHINITEWIISPLAVLSDSSVKGGQLGKWRHAGRTSFTRLRQRMQTSQGGRLKTDTGPELGPRHQQQRTYLGPAPDKPPPA